MLFVVDHRTVDVYGVQSRKRRNGVDFGINRLPKPSSARKHTIIARSRKNLFLARNETSWRTHLIPLAMNTQDHNRHNQRIRRRHPTSSPPGLLDRIPAPLHAPLRTRLPFRRQAEILQLLIHKLDRLNLMTQPQQRRRVIDLPSLVSKQDVKARGVEKRVERNGVVHGEFQPGGFHGVGGAEGAAEGDGVGPGVHEGVVEDLMDEEGHAAGGEDVEGVEAAFAEYGL